MKNVIVLFVVLIVLLAGCAGASVEDQDGILQTGQGYTVEYHLVNGIPCIVYDGYRTGGISCDWR